MTRPFRQLLFRGITIALVVFIAGYGLFEARKLIVGPHISLAMPKDGATLEGPVIHVKGTAENISYLSINGARAFVDAKGHFDQELSPAPGFSSVTVSATDRFGRETWRSVSFTLADYCPVS